MNPENLAIYYKKNHKTFAKCRNAALKNLVNRNDLYRPSNDFITKFWFKLHLLFND